MLTKAFVTAAAAGLLVASAAYAGDGKAQKIGDNPHAEGTASTSTSVNPSLSSTPSQSNSAWSAQTGMSSDVSATAPMSSMDALAAGGTVQIVASTPVADTPENRALYGEPMSNTGKRTRPAGN